MQVTPINSDGHADARKRARRVTAKAHRLAKRLISDWPHAHTDEILAVAAALRAELATIKEIISLLTELAKSGSDKSIPAIVSIDAKGKWRK